MKIYVLKRNDWNWDEYDGFVVRAEDADHARRMAVRREPSTRRDPSVWSVREVAVDGRPSVVLGSMVRG